MTSSSVFFDGVAPPLITRLPPLPRSFRRPAPEGDPASHEFFTALLARAGLSAGAYRARALQRRLPACLRRLQAGCAAEARQRIESDPGLSRELLSVALLGVTEFFRDGPVFERIASVVLPALGARRERLRVWSAGCSTGQELYSVVILLAEAGLLAGADLLGTDCRPDAIEEARTGVYPWQEVAALPASRRDHAFARVGEAAVLRPALRTAITWRTGDLLARAQDGPWHLILWRNVAIYLEPDAASRVWTELVDELAPGGFIIVGKADHPPFDARVNRIAPGIYQRNGFHA
jgi:chemotaxis methyl-accepting protein methylase